MQNNQEIDELLNHAVSYTHLDVYKRQESTVLINKDIGYDIKGGVCILRNFLIVCEFRVVSV